MAWDTENRIIILDTNEDLLEALRQLFSKQGYLVTTTSELIELFDLLESNTYRLLIMEHVPDQLWDVKLVIDHLHAKRLGHCIITSNYLLGNVDEHGKNVSVRWLKRPFKIDVLLQTVAELEGQDA